MTAPAQIDRAALLDKVDALLSTHGKLLFANTRYDEQEATDYGVALLDLFRTHGPEIWAALADARAAVTQAVVRKALDAPMGVTTIGNLVCAEVTAEHLVPALTAALQGAIGSNATQPAPASPHAKRPVAWLVNADSEDWITRDEDEANANLADGFNVRPLVFGGPPLTQQPAPASPQGVSDCEDCGGHGWTEEGDPEIGSAPMGCDACSGLGWAAPVAATLRDAVRDPALTLAIARELLVATAAGIERGEYTAAGAAPEGWVSVADRLPTDDDYRTARYVDDDVVVRFRYTDRPDREWDVGTSRHFPDENVNGGWLFGSCDHVEVSHWMRKDDLLAMLAAAPQPDAEVGHRAASDAGGEP